MLDTATIPQDQRQAMAERLRLLAEAVLAGEVEIDLHYGYANKVEGACVHEEETWTLSAVRRWNEELPCEV